MIRLMQLRKRYIVTTLLAIFLECLLCHISYAQVTVSPVTQHSDQWLEGKLQGVLDYNAYLKSSDVDVSVRGGIITLRGSVPSKAERDFAVKVAGKIAGTSKVVDNIQVNGKLTSRSRNDLELYLSDCAIEAKIKVLLSAFRLTHDAHLKVEVKNSIVYLKGNSLDNEVRIRAGKAANSVYGVKEVKNFIQLKESEDEVNEADKEQEAQPEEEFKVNDGWISDKVHALLEYNTSFSGSDVLVATKSGSVELKGRVKDANQKAELFTEVRDILGVTNVDSSLEIRGSF